MKLPDRTTSKLLKLAESERHESLSENLKPLPDGWSLGEPLRVGMKIAFTGCDWEQRERLEELSVSRGCRLTGSVSGKTDILVTDGSYSGNKAEAAQKAGKFADEITPFTVKTRKGDIVVDADEYIRHGANIEAMQKMRPAFTRDGSVTAANASGINDGAAAVLLMSADNAEKRGIEPLARIVSYATAGLDPAVMGVGPVYASRKALDKADWTVDDLDLIEANEAFAAQACAVNKDMGWDPAKVNVNGGAIAIGHPIGASGCRVLNTLLFEMQRSNAKKGLATLCIGGGMGVALCVERP